MHNAAPLSRPTTRFVAERELVVFFRTHSQAVDFLSGRREDGSLCDWEDDNNSLPLDSMQINPYGGEAYLTTKDKWCPGFVADLRTVAVVLNASPWSDLGFDFHFVAGNPFPPQLRCREPATHYAATLELLSPAKFFLRNFLGLVQTTDMRRDQSEFHTFVYRLEDALKNHFRDVTPEVRWF